MNAHEKRFFDWLKRNHPSFSAYFWKLQKAKNNGQLGATVTSGRVDSAIFPEADVQAVSSGGLLDNLKNLADLYYDTQLQKAQVDAQIAAAKAAATPPPTVRVPPLKGFSFGIEPQTGLLAVAALVGLWALARTAR